MRQEDEKPVPSAESGVFFLRKVLDVTQQTREMISQGNINTARPMSSRKISHLM